MVVVRAAAAFGVDPSALRRLGGNSGSSRGFGNQALQPNVVEFLDVVMHHGGLEFRLEEISVRPSAGSRRLCARRAFPVTAAARRYVRPRRAGGTHQIGAQPNLRSQSRI
jgi:hypothetical protein